MLASINLFAQTELLKFDFRSVTKGGKGVVVFSNQTNLTITDFTAYGEGITITGQDANVQTKTWNATSYSASNTEYCAIKVTPTNGASIDLSTISLNVSLGAADKSPNNIKIIASKDEFDTHIVLGEILEITTKQANLNNLSFPDDNTMKVNSGETVEIRFIVWSTREVTNVNFNFITLILSGTYDAGGLKDAPENHVTDFAANLGTPDYNTVVLSWTDSEDADGYLIKEASRPAPDNGTPETNSSGYVYNVASGVETVTFTPMCENVNWSYKIYPYNNSGGDILYKTDGTVPQANVTTAIEPGISPIIATDGLAAANNTDNQWVKGFIRGVINTINPNTIYIDPTEEQVNTAGNPPDANIQMNVLLADNKVENNVSNMFYAKLSDVYIRSMLNLQNNYTNLNKAIAIKGKIVNGAATLNGVSYKGFSLVYSFRWLTDDDIITHLFKINENLIASGNQGSIHVNGITTPSTIHVYTLVGKLLQSTYTANHTCTIENLQKAYYLVTVSNEYGADSFKVLVK
jgi:hypothetical protein